MKKYEGTINEKVVELEYQSIKELRKRNPIIKNVKEVL